MSKSTAPNLKLVTHRVVDITKLLRADIIVRDWKGVHTQGDRNPPLELNDRPKRGWLK